MKRSTSIVLGCLLVAAGVFAGRFTPGKSGASPAGDSSELRQELAEVRSTIEDLRRSVERGGGTRTVLVPAPPVAPSPSACPSDTKPVDEAARLEQQRSHPAWQNAEVLVATAIDRGRWTQSDIQRFRELSREATDVDMVPLMQRVDAAINARRLRPDPDLIELH
jgi:hypothetical protein